MKYIILTQNKKAKVDEVDYEWLSRSKWYYHKGYAVRNTTVGNKQKTLFMHRVINSTPPGLDTDHINRDKLDNRRSNLRNATRQQNVNNSGCRITNKSGVKGVCWHKTDKLWRAQITKNGKKYFLGRFKTIGEARVAYEQASNLSTD